MKFLVLICVLCGILFISPQLRFEQFNLLDIAETTSLEYSDILEDTMRFRPLFYIERITLNTIFPHVRFYFLFSGILSGVILYLCVLTIRKFHSATLPVLLLLGIVYFLSPVMVDSFWRLGTAENLLTLLLVASLFLFISKHYYFSLLSILGLLMSKETAVFFMPIYAGVYWLQKKYIFTILILTVLAIFLPFFLSRPLEYAMSPGNYTSLFTYSPADVGRIAVGYIRAFPQLFILGGVCILIFVKNRQQKNLLNRTLLLIMTAISFISVLFFDNIQAYYLLPFHVLISIFLVSELFILKNHLLRLILAIFIIGVVLTNVKSVGQKMYFWHVDYAVDGPLVQFLQNPPVGLFQIGEGNREDHGYALKMLLGNQVVRNYVMADYLITKYEYIPEGFQLYRHFCADVFFEENVCRWYILEKK